MSKPVLTLNGVTKIYQRGKRSTPVVAAKDVTFTIHEGQVVALVGESGSGKTTLGRLITGIEAPTSGTIEFESDKSQANGKRSRNKQDMRRVQMVFQDPYAALNPFNTVEYTLMRPLINHRKLSRSQSLEQAHELLKTVHLTPTMEFLPKRPDQLSGGQRQRVVVARALASLPEIIVADEPTSMLDVSIRADIVSLLDNLRKSHRVRGILYITHDLLSARYLADELIVLYRGKVVEKGKTDVIMGNPQHPYTQLLWSALPNPYRDSTDSPNVLKQMSAHEGTPDHGCPFAPRCPFVKAHCTKEDPPLTLQEDGRMIACPVVSTVAQHF